MQRKMRVLVLAAAVVMSARLTASSRAAGSPPSRPDEVSPRVKLEIKDAGVFDAAEQFSAATGFRLYVPPERELAPPLPFDTVARAFKPPLDYHRKASLSCKDASISQALRIFANAYHCRLVSGYQASWVGDVAVLGGLTVGGPTTQAENYEVRLDHVDLEQRTEQARSTATTSDRSIHLRFAFRALDGDPLTAWGAGYVRLTDQSGRVAQQWPDDAEDWNPAVPPERWIPASLSAYPDEFLTDITVPWPYPAPHRFQTIEGDVILRPATDRSRLELPLPGPGASSTVRQESGATVELTREASGPTSSSYALKLTLPQGYTGNLVTEVWQPLAAVLADGRRVRPAVLDGLKQSVGEGGRRCYAMRLALLDPPSAPVKLEWAPAFSFKSWRRVHFRLNDYPANLDVTEPSAKTGKPATGSRPQTMPRKTDAARRHR